MNPDINWFFSKPTKWQAEYAALRALVSATNLEETLKWGKPCYVSGKHNVVLIHGFKEYCALLFMKGAIMKDPKNLLVQQTENVQAARQIRFTSLQEIIKNKAAITSILKEAMAIEKAGLKVELKKTDDFKMPQEFAAILKEMPELKTAFEGLTPGRQRSYLLYFAAAKQSTTRENRIEKYIPAILDGKGLND